MEEVAVNVMLKQTEDASAVFLYPSVWRANPKQNLDVFVMYTDWLSSR